VDQSLSYQSNEQIAATSFKKQPQYANRPNQRREWKPFKNSPGKDDDIHAHVKILRKLPSTTNGGRGYCKEKGHLAPICYNLADELPDGWKPDPEKPSGATSFQNNTKKEIEGDFSTKFTSQGRTNTTINSGNFQGPCDRIPFFTFPRARHTIGRVG
jgi:hypothetical protein